MAEIEQLGSAEISEWIAYTRDCEPLPDPYWCAALVALEVRRLNATDRAEAVRLSRLTPDDLLGWRKPVAPAVESVAAMEAKIKAWCIASGGRL